MINEPFFFEGARRDIAVLLIHGFTGNPDEMRPMGEALQKAGYSAQGLLLPGHGKTPFDLKGYRWMQWAEHGADALRHLQQQAEHVFVCGLSMGGLISLHLAANMPGISGVIAMSAPARINSPLARLVPLAKYVIPYFGALDKADFSNPVMQRFVQRQAPPGVTVDFADQAQIAEVRKAARIPLGAIEQLMQLNRRVVDELSQVKTPVFFAQGRLDTTITPMSADILAERVKSTEKQVRWYEQSAHMLPLEPDAPALFDDVIRFISQYAE